MTPKVVSKISENVEDNQNFEFTIYCVECCCISIKRIQQSFQIQYIEIYNSGNNYYTHVIPFKARWFSIGLLGPQNREKDLKIGLERFCLVVHLRATNYMVALDTESPRRK